MLKRSTSSNCTNKIIKQRILFPVTASSTSGLFLSTKILFARKEDEDLARTWKLPSFLTKFLDQTAPAHLRGSYLAEAKDIKEKQDAADKQQKEDEEKKSQRKSAATNAAKVSFSSEERGFVKSAPGDKKNSSSSSSSSAASASGSGSKKVTSHEKYGVNWSNEETAAEDTPSSSSAATSSSSSGSSPSKFGTNLTASKQFIDEETVATDVLAGNQAQSLAGAPGAAKKEKGPSMFNRAWQTFKMSRDDASAIRDEDADNEAKGLRDDELQTGRYFKKLHATSLKSWTKQCFLRMPEVEECTLISVEVEQNPETDVVSVFVTAKDLDDKKLTLVKKWVEEVCPVSKARDKLIQRMEDEERKRQSHVLASPTASSPRYNNSMNNRRVVTDPMKQFAKRRNIRWIRIDPDQ